MEAPYPAGLDDIVVGDASSESDGNGGAADDDGDCDVVAAAGGAGSAPQSVAGGLIPAVSGGGSARCVGLVVLLRDVRVRCGLVGCVSSPPPPLMRGKEGRGITQPRDLLRVNVSDGGKRNHRSATVPSLIML